MSITKIITVSGPARNGKDEFAKIAKEYYEELGKKCIIFHYADFLKFICKEYFGWNGEKDETGRTLLQHVGTEIFRQNNPDCWTEMAKLFVSGLGGEVEYVIIPDTRFPNEIMCWWYNKNFKVASFKVTRPNFDNGLTMEQKSHSSEIALNNWEQFDKVIVNDGSLEDYKNKIITALKELKRF